MDLGTESVAVVIMVRHRRRMVRRRRGTIELDLRMKFCKYDYARRSTREAELAVKLGGITAFACSISHNFRLPSQASFRLRHLSLGKCPFFASTIRVPNPSCREQCPLSCSLQQLLNGPCMAHAVMHQIQHLNPVKYVREVLRLEPKIL